MLWRSGWQVGRDRVERIWRRGGLKVPQKQRPRRRLWLLGTHPLYIEPSSPWENGYCKNFSGKLREECLNGEIFYSLKEARIVIEQWRQPYNRIRPHAALGYRPPVPGAYTPHWNPVLRPQRVM